MPLRITIKNSVLKITLQDAIAFDVGDYTRCDFACQDVSYKKTEEFSGNLPKPYSEDTLLSAMENAGKDDIPDEAERKGLGTPATRAAIIEKLVAAGFVERKGKSLIPTKAGINLVTVLPSPLSLPSLLLLSGLFPDAPVPVRSPRSVCGSWTRTGLPVFLHLKAVNQNLQSVPSFH